MQVAGRIQPKPKPNNWGQTASSLDSLINALGGENPKKRVIARPAPKASKTRGEVSKEIDDVLKQLK